MVPYGPVWSLMVLDGPIWSSMALNGTVWSGFYMGPHYVDFTFTFDTTLISLEMTEIWPEYVAQAFSPPPLNCQLRTPPGIGLNIIIIDTSYLH